MNEENKSQVDIVETYFHIKNTDEYGIEIAKVVKIPIYIVYERNIERINDTDAVAICLDLQVFQNVIWNHIKLPHDNFSIPKFLHPGTRILVVGFPHGISDSNDTKYLKKPFWKVILSQLKLL
jgi:hypothetical protein